MSDDTPTRPQTPISKQFAPVDCPLCFYEQLWKGAARCPGCGRTPEEILEEGVGKISKFKRPGLYASYPGLPDPTPDTIPEMAAVRPEEKKR